MPVYVWCLLAGILLAVFSEKSDQLTGGNPLVRRLLSVLCPLLVMMGFAGGAVVRIFA